MIKTETVSTERVGIMICSVKGGRILHSSCSQIVTFLCLGATSKWKKQFAASPYLSEHTALRNAK